ncbi:hypothetical protein EVAR_65870_1 [Eumeta japonica]|uniref:Uncharacterized protein n=1 Tax=Eumeta variegata TaxID=151549 RepID=A0A4C1ZB62_EUMVA|nr:hypothetical protein EVAR_65870_1 [Eumeta japonica]
MVSVAGADAEPSTSARIIAHAHTGRWRRASGMRSGNRRLGREQNRLRTSPAAQLRLASRAAVRSIRLKPRTLPTTVRRTSMDCRPQVKAARIGDPLRADLTEHAADR